MTDPRYKDSEFAEEFFEPLRPTRSSSTLTKRSTVTGPFTRNTPRVRIVNMPSSRSRSCCRLQGSCAKRLQSLSVTSTPTRRLKRRRGPFQVGQIFERLEDSKEQRRIWKLFIERHSETVGMESLIIEALGKLSDLALARKDKRGHKKLREQILAEYVARNMAEDAAAYVAAKAQFQIIEEDLAKYNKIRVKSTNPKKANETIQAKIASQRPSSSL